MPIVPQSKPPQLLLGAPKIAGLLPAHAASLHRADLPPDDRFTYSNPILASLPPKIKTEMTRLVTTMLDGVADLLGGRSNEFDFAQRAQRFTGQMQLLYDDTIIVHTGPYQEPDYRWTRPRNGDEMDREMEDMLTQAKARIEKTRQDAEARTARRRAERAAEDARQDGAL